MRLLVQLESVGKDYPGGRGAVVAAVDGVDLDVADGEFLVLVGPSGCGKSTTLRVIAGLETTSRGTIRIRETVVDDVPPGTATWPGSSRATPSTRT